MIRVKFRIRVVITAMIRSRVMIKVRIGIGIMLRVKVRFMVKGMIVATAGSKDVGWFLWVKVVLILIHRVNWDWD